MSSLDIKIPTKGGWPVDPQDDIAISQDRIWIDGCFDFSHHGIIIIRTKLDAIPF